jgi:hypothetical protein
MVVDIDLIMEPVNDEDNGEEQEKEGGIWSTRASLAWLLVCVTSTSRHAVNAARLLAYQYASCICT